MKKITLLAFAAFFAVSIVAQTKMRIWMGDVVAFEQNVTRIDSVTFVFDNEGALTGEFSVSPTKKVRFSKGNLQYQASTDTWRFAENQWDYVGDDINGTVYENGVKCNNYLISDTYSGWIDLFGWGTGDKPTQYDLSADYDIFVDWGNNTIVNSPNNISWRTPEVAEYEYLLYERVNASLLYGMSYVNNYLGLVLLPDNWDSGTIKNTYSIDEWEIMERQGAVFLPASDSRTGKARDMGSTGGYYWTASIYSSSYGASTLRLWNSSDVDISYYDVRSYGRFVRLVEDVNTSIPEQSQTVNPFVEMINDSIVNIILPPDDEIWYTSLTNDTLPFPLHNGTIISNTYVNGKGIYKFDSPITNEVFCCQGGFRSDTIEDNPNETFSLITSLVLPTTVTALDNYQVLADLAYSQYLIFPYSLSSIGTDFIGGFGKYRDDGHVHVFFTSPIAPEHDWRTFWNTPSNDGIIYHYPIDGDYSSFIQSIDEEMAIEPDWKYSWQPTTYVFQ